MKKLLLATHNPAKLRELKKGAQSLIDQGVKIYSLSDLNIRQGPEETGKDFNENALIKAKFYSQLSDLPTIADDGGLTIPYLNNEPGVKSRRWLDYDATDEELINYTLKRLHGVALSDRTAYLNVCLCFYDPQTKQPIYEEEKIIGHIAEIASARRINGYPFRALFIVNQFGKYYDELTEQEHKIINHRLKAVKRLVQKIKPYLLQ